MFLVNMVYDDEELLEPYEWQDDDCYEEFHYLPIYRVSQEQLHDFIYCQMVLEGIEDSIFVVGDGQYRDKGSKYSSKRNSSIITKNNY